MLKYIPKYIKQNSDLNYGEKVTHENYNEKLNLNTTQGDYNTEVLDKFFNSTAIEDTYHIGYVDKEFERVDNDITQLDSRIDTVENAEVVMIDDLDSIHSTIASIINGAITTGHSTLADNLVGLSTAAPRSYYGTDENSNRGFIEFPNFIFAEDAQTATGIEGVYYSPAPDSILEYMLSSDLRTKINRVALADYNYLDNKPSINGATLEGNKSLADLGIQSVGNYVTESTFNSTIANYSTTVDTKLWVNTQLENYALAGDVRSAEETANTARDLANNAVTAVSICARVGINEYVENPKDGDIYFEV